MVGNDGHHINYANGIKGEAGKRLFNLLNCLLLAEKKPATVNMLEAAYLEVMLTNIQNIHCRDNIYKIFDIFLDGGFSSAPPQVWFPWQAPTPCCMV